MIQFIFQMMLQGRKENVIHADMNLYSLNQALIKKL